MGLYALLQRCFSTDPSERPECMFEVSQCVGWIRGLAERERSRGEAYTGGGLTIPVAPGFFDSLAFPNDRRTTYEGEELDPQGWLAAAFVEDGRDPADVDALLPVSPTTARGQAKADLSTYEQALGIYDRLVANGRNDLIPVLAKICKEKAVIHLKLGDFSAADLMCDRALSSCEGSIRKEDKRVAQAAVGIGDVVAKIREAIRNRRTWIY
jgi:hypothetical protein